MKRLNSSMISLLLVLAVTAQMTVTAFAAVKGQNISTENAPAHAVLASRSADSRIKDAVEKTAAYVYESTPSPQVGSVGGDWSVLGLARSGYAVPDAYLADYAASVIAYVKAVGGVLHEKKYTEYSRVITVWSALGLDARNVGGYDLTKALGDYDATVSQGLNGPIWALIALDTRDYPMPKNPKAKTQASRQMYVDRILSMQGKDGGWSLFGGSAQASDIDLTAMALQALAKYTDQKKVAEAVERGIVYLSEKQNRDGSFSSYGSSNTESCAQVAVALCELGISCEDARFTKNGKTVADALLAFCQRDGSFVHTAGGSGSDRMATEQALYALAALARAEDGEQSLYRMSDAKTIVVPETSHTGLPKKHADVKAVPITAPGTTFPDISGKNAHPAQAEIEALAARGIINGKGNGLFDPDTDMTRAEFCTIVVRSLGLTPKAVRAFSDVPAAAWYAPFVGTAYSYGIVQGVGDGKFNPLGTISRQEAAVMVTRAAKLCGMEVAMTNAAVLDELSPFADYIRVPDWARSALAFCFREGILDNTALKIEGTKPILRCEIAVMLFRLLSASRLL